MALLAAAVAGGALGARHALEPDHLAAVATLVDDPAPDRPGLVGASWGVGHTVPIAALGFAFLLLGVRLPASATGLVEAVVGVVLVALGVRALGGALDRFEHAHGIHPLHRHVGVGWLSVGGGHPHLHVHGDSLAVGALHGVAGSGALVVALVAAAPDVATATAFLTAFGLCSVGTMAAVSAAWGRTLSVGDGRGERALRAVAGVVGVAVGLVLLVEGVAPLLPVG